MPKKPIGQAVLRVMKNYGISPIMINKRTDTSKDKKSCQNRSKRPYFIKP